MGVRLCVSSEAARLELRPFCWRLAAPPAPSRPLHAHHLFTESPAVSLVLISVVEMPRCLCVEERRVSLSRKSICCVWLPCVLSLPSLIPTLRPSFSLSFPLSPPLSPFPVPFSAPRCACRAFSTGAWSWTNPSPSPPTTLTAG